jgi:hypothetical protein
MLLLQQPMLFIALLENKFFKAFFPSPSLSLSLFPHSTLFLPDFQ